MSTPIRVLLVEDQNILREGLHTILDLEQGITVVGEAANGLQAVEMAAALQPNVVLMDLQMPVMDGVEATRRILACQPEIKVVVLTTYDHDSLVLNALRAGAKCYLLKDDPADEMIRAIRLAHRGESLLQPVVAAKLLDAFAQMPPQPVTPIVFTETHAQDGNAATLDALTERERQVLALVAEGAGNLHIARRLHLAEGTVKNHLSVIMDKLGAENRTQAVAIARQQGLIA